jgi:hypothetical protein
VEELGRLQHNTYSYICGFFCVGGGCSKNVAQKQKNVFICSICFLVWGQ